MKSWISTAVIYQVNLRSLAAREPRNAMEAAREKKEALSPLAYLTKNLPVIKQLGANVVYLLPPYPIGFAMRKGIGSPYSSRDFKAVEPEYGTLRELAAMVRRAHKLGLKVIFDITPNHTSRDHVWALQHPEFYVKDQQGDLYFDCDWSDTAKLDYTKPELRREMIRVYDFWLSFLGKAGRGKTGGIDGFRLDMAHFINDRSFWNEALPLLRDRHAGRELLFLAECYGLQNNMDLFSRGITAAYDDDFYKVCQNFYAIRHEDGASCICPSQEAKSSQDFKDKYEAFVSGGIAGAMARAITSYRESLPKYPGAHFLARYTDNHDEGRGLYRFGEGAARAVSCVIFFAPDTLPFLLTGQEFGALNRPSIHDRIRPCDKGRRITAPNHLWHQDGVEIEGNVFARGMKKRTEWYAFYKRLIQLRLKHPEFTRGEFQLLETGEEGPADQRSVIAFERKLGNSRIRCAINLGPEDRKLDKAGALFSGKPLWGSLDNGVLKAFQAVVVKS
ncbi:MAG: alpha-amylase family glycosyl hydrolase [Lentisphaerota bacterium]